MNVAIWFMTGIAAVFFGLRLYCKRIRHNKLWWDDYILIAAFVGSLPDQGQESFINSHLQTVLVTQTSMLSVCISLGLGKHNWDIRNWPDYLYMLDLTGDISIIAAALSKTSFAVTLLRLTTGWMRRLIWFIIVSVNVFLGLSCIFQYVQCTPVRKLWHSNIAGSCWNHEVIIKYNTFSSSKFTPYSSSI